ncbi:Zinc finger protein 407 [Manis javanica]|nr:Zinc finger protein 407 [Manis javanica]
MALAYERLPDAVKALIAPLRARHSIECTFGAAMPIERRLALKAQYPDAEHPVVRTHPETGEKVLFVNGFHHAFHYPHTPANVRVGQDFTQGASGLLQYLIGQAAIPEYQVRWRWRAGSVADLGQPRHPALRGHGLPGPATGRWSAGTSARRPSEPRLTTQGDMP